jgi:hypothetical protein
MVYGVVCGGWCGVWCTGGNGTDSGKMGGHSAGEVGRAGGAVVVVGHPVVRSEDDGRDVWQPDARV